MPVSEERPLEIAPESRAFLVKLFTDLRTDLADRMGVEGGGSLDPEQAERDLAMYDVLLAGLTQREAFPDDEALRRYVAGFARGVDEGNKYEQAVLEHRALAELSDALAKRK